MAIQRARTAFRNSLAVIGLVGALAACTSGGTNKSDPLAGVQVPNAYTPLTVAPISQPTFPFPGTDGKYHLAFDMQITNSTSVPAGLNAVDVVDANDPTKVLASFSGKQLVGPDCNYRD